MWIASPRSEVQAHICLPVRGTSCWALLQHYYFAIIFHHRVWYCALRDWVYSKYGHHPHPLGYLCAKFCFFRGLYCSEVKKIIPSRKIAESLTELIWCPRNWSASASKLRFGTYTKLKLMKVKLALGALEVLLHGHKMDWAYSPSETAQKHGNQTVYKYRQYTNIDDSRSKQYCQ